MYKEKEEKMELKNIGLLSLLAVGILLSGCNFGGTSSGEPVVTAGEYGDITLISSPTLSIESTAGVSVIADLGSYQGPVTIYFTTDNDNLTLDASSCAMTYTGSCYVVAYGQTPGPTTITATDSLYGYTPGTITITVES